MVGPWNSFSWIHVLDFRHICECSQWFSISTVAKSCIRVGLEREFDTQTSHEKLLCVVTSVIYSLHRDKSFFDTVQSS